MLLYADEDIPFRAVEELRRLGHDVVTVRDDGRSATPDDQVLARAHSLGRPILTHNRRHYERLHRQAAEHNGILSATQDRDHDALAARIDAALRGRTAGRWCIRVNRPP